jgi:hypothetical protein
MFVPFQLPLYAQSEIPSPITQMSHAPDNSTYVTIYHLHRTKHTAIILSYIVESKQKYSHAPDCC